MARERPGDDRDLYADLGVPAAASQGEITRAFRRLVRALHPDTRRSAADPATLPAADENRRADPATDENRRADAAPEADARRLAEVLHAYGVLGDAARRAEYDRRRTPTIRRRTPTTPDPLTAPPTRPPQGSWPGGLPPHIRPGDPHPAGSIDPGGPPPRTGPGGPPLRQGAGGPPLRQGPGSPPLRAGPVYIVPPSGSEPTAAPPAGARRPAAPDLADLLAQLDALLRRGFWW